MSFEALFAPFEHLDERLTDLFAGAPLLVALSIAFVLGLRHASDPDHLVAVTSLLARRDSDVRDAARVGAWWGIGHALTLVAIGVPLILLKSSLPAWLERGAEIGVGVIILLLAGRVVWKWSRGHYRAGSHRHDVASADPGEGPGAHRHLHRGQGGDEHRHPDAEAARTPMQAFWIGVVHGLAGTGAVVVLLIAALPGRLEAAAAMAVFAPMSVISMAAMTAAFAWLLTRPIVEPVYRAVLIPLLGAFGLLFGLWYAGIGV
jgi:ABC-type nickel/cobalt efflux system permease component RcnA